MNNLDKDNGKTIKEILHPLAEFAGILSHEDAENMIQMIEQEFEQVNPDEWKS